MPSLGYEGSLEDFNPDDIRGKYTFEEVSQATGIPAEVIKEKFELTDEEFCSPYKGIRTRNQPGERVCKGTSEQVGSEVRF